MKRIAWLTDIHLNFVKPELLAEFFHHLRAYSADVIMIGGDVAEATDVAYYLAMIDDELHCPVYFVLGNHDFYFGSIKQVRREVEELCSNRPNLIYLTATGVHRLTDRVGLVGHDSWADARIGDYERSMVMMNDYKLIRELAGVNKEDRWPLLKQMGDEAAAALRTTLTAALDTFDMVYVLTHVPPLREACWYDGRISDDEWAPHFTCRAVGDVLLEVVREHPTRQVTVLCGHTHGSGECWPLKNLRVLTGGAEYGFPAVNRLFTIR
jgi:predicted MPP superfamily phosphohydrolase